MVHPPNLGTFFLKQRKLSGKYKLYSCFLYTCGHKIEEWISVFELGHKLCVLDEKDWKQTDGEYFFCNLVSSRSEIIIDAKGH